MRTTRLKIICKERGISQNKLSRMSELDSANLSRIANARMQPYPGQVERIAKALEWDGDPQELFEVVEEDEER